MNITEPGDIVVIVLVDDMRMDDFEKSEYLIKSQILHALIHQSGIELISP